jgi:hypothetical protein
MTRSTPPAGDPAARPARASKPPKKRSKITPSQCEAGGEGPLNKHWRTYFLAALTDTSNVTAAAAQAGVAPSRAYKVRREDPEFAAKWRAALCDGYQNLEMEVLGFLRDKAPERKMDIAGAIRLLSLHRDTVARERIDSDRRDEREVYDSIDALIDEMRERAAANAAILAPEVRKPEGPKPEVAATKSARGVDVAG